MVERNIIYELYSEQYGYKQIVEPKNWDNSEREITENSEFKGLFSKLSNSLEFSQDGYDYIMNLYRSYGANADLTLIRKRKNPKKVGEDWEVTETGTLNLMTLEINDEDKTCSLKFDEDDLWSRISSRKGTKVDLSADITQKDLQLDGRRIFLNSRLKIDGGSTVFHDSSNRDILSVIPWIVEYNSDEENISFPPNVADDIANNLYFEGNGETGNCFYVVADRDHTINIEIFVKAEVAMNYLTGVRIDLVRYENAGSFNFKSTTSVPLTILSSTTTGNLVKANIEASYSATLNMLEGESLALYVLASQAIDEGGVNYTYGASYIQIQEDSQFETTFHKILPPWELFDALCTRLLSRPNSFYSELFGRTSLGYASDGELAYLGITTGYQLRNIEGRQFNTSFSDAFDSYNAITPLCAFVDYVNNKRVIRIESLKYRYQKFPGISIASNDIFYRISNVTRKVSEDMHYSSIECGYDKGGGDYEEALGLDEHCGKSTYITPITKTENAYDIVSKYRADGYGIEFARRKPIAIYPDEDTRYDEDIFMIDCKEIGGIWVPKLWSDYYTSLPQGIYSPETALNLGITPARNLLRHGWVLKACLNKSGSEITFASSNANNGLITDGFDENGAILIGSLERHRFVPETFEFEAPTTEEIYQAANARNQNGDLLIYGFAQLDTPEGKEYIYITKLSLTETGKWTALKAFV